MTIHHPYPQLQVYWSDDHKGFTLTLPWLSLEVEVSPDEKPWIQQAIHLLHTEPENILVQNFLEAFKDHHIAYPAPRAKELCEHDSPPIKVPLPCLPLSSPVELVGWIAPCLPLQEFCPPNQWQWDMAQITKFSHIEGTQFYDPQTIVSFLHGKSLELDAQGGEYRQELIHLLEELRKEDETTFFSFMSQLLRQTHYITQKFQEYCPLSLETFPQGQEEIEQFIREEKGHDKLMSASLHFLGYDIPEELQVREQTKLFMDLFKKSAELCPMAFTSLVGFFEGGNYGLSDPLADLLKRSSKPQAALGYERHFEINTSSHHNQEIYCLATKLPLQTYEQVLFTARILELISLVGKSFDMALSSHAHHLLSHKEGELHTT